MLRLMRATNANSCAAKALREGQKQAFEILLKRMTRQQDWLVLPASDTVNVEDYIFKLRVQDEKLQPPIFSKPVFSV